MAIAKNVADEKNKTIITESFIDVYNRLFVNTKKNTPHTKINNRSEYCMSVLKKMGIAVKSEKGG